MTACSSQSSLKQCYSMLDVVYKVSTDYRCALCLESASIPRERQVSLQIVIHTKIIRCGGLNAWSTLHGSMHCCRPMHQLCRFSSDFRMESCQTKQIALVQVKGLLLAYIQRLCYIIIRRGGFNRWTTLQHMLACIRGGFNSWSTLQHMLACICGGFNSSSTSQHMLAR